MGPSVSFLTPMNSALALPTGDLDILIGLKVHLCSSLMEGPLPASLDLPFPIPTSMGDLLALLAHVQRLSIWYNVYTFISNVRSGPCFGGMFLCLCPLLD